MSVKRTGRVDREGKHVHCLFEVMSELEKVLSSTDEVLPDVMVYNYTPIVYISITAGVETT